jgi:hypothetical protein
MLTELSEGALIIPAAIRDPPIALTDAVSAAIIEITKKTFFIFRLAEKFKHRGFVSKIPRQSRVPPSRLTNGGTK